MTRTKIHDVLVLDLDAPGATRGPADIEIDGGRIAGIHPSDRPGPPGQETPGEPATAADRVIEGAGLLAIPGLVNAHLHSSGHFSRGLVDNLPLELFMLWELPPLEAPPAPPELYRASVLAGPAEMLRSGITSVMDDPIFAPAATEEAIDAVMGAYRDAGLRATVSVYQPNKTEYDWMPYLPQLLPPDLRRRMDEQPRPPTAAIMRMYRSFFDRWHGAAGGRLRCSASCSAPQRASSAR
jgi:cytosine/adenosine deaminase-related metal-dependent hydrolase